MQRTLWMLFGIAIGFLVGALLTVAFQDLRLGIAAGSVVGVALGALFMRPRRPGRPPGSPREKR